MVHPATPGILVCLIHGGTRRYTLKASLSSRIHADTRGYTVPHVNETTDAQAQRSDCKANFQKQQPIPCMYRRVDLYRRDLAATSLYF